MSAGGSKDLANVRQIDRAEMRHVQLYPLRASRYARYNAETQCRHAIDFWPAAGGGHLKSVLAVRRDFAEVGHAVPCQWNGAGILGTEVDLVHGFSRGVPDGYLYIVGRLGEFDAHDRLAVGQN